MIRTAIGAAVLAACGLPPLQSAALTLSPDGLTVYDSANNVSWLADVNLPATNRFGLPLCHGASIDAKTCVNASGSMSFQAASAWVAAMNAANYLGHTNWQLPTTPLTDSNCGFTGPNGASFGFSCLAGALGSLYYTGLGLHAPNTAVPIPNNTAGPFSNFQPYLYWSQTSTAALGVGTFSFISGIQGSNIKPNFLYALPMIPGKISGTPPASGNGLEINPDGQTVYDPVANVTWLANANLAATNAFGLPSCTAPGKPQMCVNQDGAMNWDSADQFVTNMNAGTGYLGQKNWQLPPVDPNCATYYNCTNSPLGELFYGQLGLSAGMPAVATPDTAVGPFRHMQPYLYWSCEAATIQEACQTTGPSSGFEFSFSFGNGFLGTDILQNEFYVTAYFVGSSTSTAGPEITEVANAEGDAPTIAPNTWIQIKGVNLAPAGFSSPDCAPGYCWQRSDFVNNTMPTQLNHVSATVNGKSAYVYYISPTQINVLTPPDPMTGPVQVVVNNNGTLTAAFTAQAQSTSPSFFYAGSYLLGQHSDYSLLAPYGSPAKPPETILLYANGFGPTSVPVVSGSIAQGGTLATLPVITIGGVKATVTFAGLVLPGEYVFAVVVPSNTPAGDQPISATYGGLTTQPGMLITIQH